MKSRRINYDSGSLRNWDSTFLAIGITKGKSSIFAAYFRDVGYLSRVRILLVVSLIFERKNTGGNIRKVS